MSDGVRYIIARRIGDHDEFLQEDGDFGPLAGVSRGLMPSGRRDVTRVFTERSYAEAVVKAYENKHPTVSLIVSLEIRSLQ